jgi:hypothetical protein
MLIECRVLICPRATMGASDWSSGARASGSNGHLLVICGARAYHDVLGTCPIKDPLTVSQVLSTSRVGGSER